MKPYYEQDGITIHHGDCREILPYLPKVDLVLTDPPYGIGWVPRVNHIGKEHLWVDDTPVDPRPFLDQECVWWGAQYYANILPPSEAWLVWVKRPLEYDFSGDRRTYATVELAWTNLPIKPAHKKIVWDGGKREGVAENRTFVHPAQKPVELMSWCISKSAANLILDPFMGSGTTLVAAKQLGRKAIGIEIEEKYCEIAVKRLAQMELFAAST